MNFRRFIEDFLIFNAGDIVAVTDDLYLIAYIGRIIQCGKLKVPELDIAIDSLKVFASHYMISPHGKVQPLKIDSITGCIAILQVCSPDLGYTIYCLQLIV